MSEVYKNDPDLVSELRKQADGKARGSVEAKLKKIFNLNEDDLKDIDKESKDALFYEEISKVALRKASSTKDKTVEKLQIELQETNAEVKRLKEEDIPNIKMQTTKEIEKFHINQKINEMLPEEKMLIIKPKIASKLVTDYLWSDYNMGINEKGELVIKTKDGLIPQNADKTKNLTVTELIDMKLVQDGLKRESNADDKKAEEGKRDFTDYKRPLKDDPEKPYRAKLRGMRAAEENIGELNKMDKK
jgi:hypothetical protein